MVQIVAVSLIFSVIILYLKTVNSELTVLALIASGIILLNLILKYVYDTVAVFKELVDLSGISYEIYSVLFKITAIGYLVEFGASTIEDFGLTSLSNKLVFCGKIIILSVSLPIIYAVINLLKALIL